MTSEHDALLAAILADPQADLPRLVYADFIEQYQHQTDRAEFIRVQVELEDMRREPKPISYLMTGGPNCRHTVPEKCGRCRDLIRRESDLWAYASKWFPGPNRVPVCLPDLRYSDFNPCSWVRRGFVAELSAPLDVLMGNECRDCGGQGRTDVYLGHGDYEQAECWNCGGIGRTPAILPRLVREQPVEFVRATDRQPRTLDDGRSFWIWTDLQPSVIDSTNPCCLPHELWLLLSEYDVRDYRRSGVKLYPTREAAEKALSDALIKWAKQQVIQ